MAVLLPKVAVLILNWNDARNTLETLESVRGLRHENFEVFLVDNGSTDGSPETIAKRFPDVHLVPSPENLGVAGGRNFGLEAIFRRSDPDYVLILDNDVILEPHLLEKLIEAVEGNPDVGIAGPVIYYSSDPERVWSAGVTIVFHEVTAKKRGRNRLQRGEPKRGIERVDCISGCCMLIQRRVFETIGRFNPQYFMVANETEFCYRAAKRGFRSAVITHAKLWHKVSASTGGGYTPARAYFTGRSTILFLKEHGRPWHWVSSIAFAALSLPVAYLREWRRGNRRAVTMKVRGYRDGLLGRPVDREVQDYFQRKQTASREETRVRVRSET